MHASDLVDIEVALFQEAIKRRYGYDFSGYAPASFKRRVIALRESFGFRTISHLTERLIYDPLLIREIIGKLSVPVSEMFRDPVIFRHIREDIMPMLATWPSINIWIAGCAQGEEVYSLSIILRESNLYDRAHIFATDFSDDALARAEEGIYPQRDATKFSKNYLLSGGSGSLSDWVTTGYQRIRVDASLRRNVTFANHNLVSDGVFGEMQLIMCRNVLIYFSDDLQDRALGLFRDSLVHGGFLCLGSRENLEYSTVSAEFSMLEGSRGIFRRGSRA